MKIYEERVTIIMKKRFSVLQNFIYTIKGANSVKKTFVPLTILQGICWGAYPIVYAWIPKVIIDLITNKISTRYLILSIALLTLVVIIFLLLERKIAFATGCHRVLVKYSWIEKRMQKAFQMEYKDLENPEILNLMDRARYASADDGNGFGSGSDASLGDGASLFQGRLQLRTKCCAGVFRYYR